MQAIMAIQLRSALGNTAISISELERNPNSVGEVIARLKKVTEILQAECKLVESRCTPTLRVGNETESVTAPFALITEILQGKDTQ